MTAANDLDDEIDVDDEMDEGSPTHVQYEIASYPSDLTLSVIHEMWRDKEITIPPFQRNFVWNIRQSSLLIESFLVGLPVPQVFFYIDKEHNNLVIDGQQRILSLIFFFEGYFGFENLQGRRQVFRLSGLPEESPFYNKKFDELSLTDQRKLKGSILRAINIRQLSPSENSTSMYHIFERLNTGGTPLRPQEIRNCVFSGPIVEKLQAANKDSNWRKIIAKKSFEKHQRDVEMILRIFSISENYISYEKPMKEFLNKQMKQHRGGQDIGTINFVSNFSKVCQLIVKDLPEKPFHIRGPINLAAMDSIMATLINSAATAGPHLGKRYAALISDKKYQDAIFFNTSDISAVKERMRIAHEYLVA